MKRNYLLTGTLALLMAITSCSEESDTPVNDSSNLQTRSTELSENVENFTMNKFYKIKNCYI